MAIKIVKTYSCNHNLIKEEEKLYETAICGGKLRVFITMFNIKGEIIFWWWYIVFLHKPKVLTFKMC